MENEPPQGSKIRMERHIDSTCYIWTEDKRGFAHYVISAFMLLWFCAWTAGGGITILLFITLLFRAISGGAPWLAVLFTMAWLGGWTIGEVVVFETLYRALRRQKPAVLTLLSGRIRFETGTRPLILGQRTQTGFCSHKQLDNRIYELSTIELANLRLERVGDEQRLSFDRGVERVEIGQSLSEPERQWLYEVLLEHAPQLSSGEDIRESPPYGSRIQVEQAIDSTTYIWKNYDRRFTAVTAFLIVWLAGWIVIGIAIQGASSSGANDDKGLGPKNTGMWAAGAIAAGMALYLSLRPQKPSILTLSAGKVRFETGTVGLASLCDRRRLGRLLSSMSGLTNRVHEMSTSEVQNLRLRKYRERHELTVEYQGQTVEIGRALTEPETEWLYQTLTQHLGV
ncbi:MAG: hypothetical protein ACYS29_13400 [Planctomycetota bacterium]|jgi:hypothetical protein